MNSSHTNQIDLLSMTQEELIKYCLDNGYQAYRGKQLYQWLHQKCCLEYQQMTNLPKNMISELAEKAFITLPKLIKTSTSSDKSTVKMLLELNDGALVECVIMLYERENSRNRRTICISTQVGCGLGCKFCATALAGLSRNLTAGEIVAQVIFGEIWCRENNLDGISNVVYMGMGEPLANFSNVIKSINILNSEQGLNIGHRKITVSTCGLIPEMNKLAEMLLPIGLAISLHAPINQLRSELLPINDKYPIEELIKCADNYSDITGRRISYEYALFKGINDTPLLAHTLGKLLKGHLCHINLIPANLVKETGFLPSDSECVQEFANIIRNYNIETTVREKRGIDIDAACGQLRNNNLVAKKQADR